MPKKLDCRLKINKSKKSCVNKTKSSKKENCPKGSRRNSKTSRCVKSKSVKLVALYTPKQQAASNTGIPVKRENVILNLLLIPRNLIAVITVPDLLIPGTKAKI